MVRNQSLGRSSESVVAEPYGRCVETQPHAGFGFSLIIISFTYILCLGSKYAPTVPPNHYFYVLRSSVRASAV
jgi:hypothetical protein